MDATTKRTCQMLRADDAELRAAAARVLGELRPTDAAVLRALSDVLAQDPGPAQVYALAALASSPTPQAVSHLLPALAGPQELRHAAIEAIAAFGPKAVAHLRDPIRTGDPTLRKAAASALARIGGKAAHDLLLRSLTEDDPHLARHVCFVLDRAIGAMTDAQRARLLAQVEKFLALKRTREHEGAVVGALQILGMLRMPKARKTLLAFALPLHPPEVRRRALLALRGIAESLPAAAIARLLPCLEEDDLANVVLPAIAVLEPLPLPADVASRVLRLAHSAHPPVRDFAVRKMGRLDTPAAARELIADLDSPEPKLRDLAAASLRRNPAAVPLLVKRIDKESEPDRLWTLARILEPHAAQLTPTRRRKLAALLLECLESNDARAEPLAALLRVADPEALDKALLARAKALKAKKRFDEADRLLTTLVRGGAPSTEALYQAAVVALKVSPQRLGRGDRQADPCLRCFDRLLSDDTIDLLVRLKAEKALGPEDLFYVGFHFAEQLRERRAFGGALLDYVVTKHPRKAIAASARNKLRLEAFPVGTATRERKAAGKASGGKAARKK